MANYFYFTPDGKAVGVDKDKILYCSTGEAREQQPGRLYLVGDRYPMPEISGRDGIPVQIKDKRHGGRCMSAEAWEGLEA